MKVCLIIPPSPFLLDERVFMSLGVLKVAASLEAARVPVEVLDLSGYSNAVEILLAHARQNDADVYGLTATTPQYPAAVVIAKTLRAAVPHARIVLGGPHATLTHAATKREKSKGVAGRATKSFTAMGEVFDCIVAGDGEMAVLEAIQDGAPATIDADGRHSSFFQSDMELEASAWPARHLVEVPSYNYKIDGAPALSLIAQLGCPFACGFCAGRHSPMLRHVRRRSSANVVREMMHMADTYGCRGYMFYDDELNVNPSMVELMEQIARASCGEWRLRGFIKSELFDDQQARSMRVAGFREILVGFESGSPRILGNINKRATIEDNSACMDAARRAGLKVKALMSVGHPGETLQTIEETRRWLLYERPDEFDVTVITPYPGSPYYDEAAVYGGHYTYTARSGDRLHMADVDYASTADYYKGAPGAYVSHVWTDTLSAADLVQCRDDLEASVRQRLNLPFNSAAPALAYEHSMGQTALPLRILRTSHAGLSR